MTETRPHGGPIDNPDAAHEPSDVSFRGVLGFAIGLFLLGVVFQVGLYFLLRHWIGASEGAQPSISPLAAEERGQLPTGPVLEGFLPTASLRQRQDSLKVPPADYGWVDRQAGVVKIPVADAMRILAKKLPARPESEPGPPAKEVVPPAETNSGRTLERSAP